MLIEVERKNKRNKKKLYFEILYTIQRKICNIIRPDLTSRLPSLSSLPQRAFSINNLMVILLKVFPLWYMDFRIKVQY